MTSTNAFAPEPRLWVHCRPARVEDTPAVLALSSLIWEGEDYIPYVWEEWLRDEQGLLLVAEHSGNLVGFGKLTRLSAEDWWMEGLRVHPQYERRGIATQLHEALLAHWEKVGSGAVRLATSSSRLAVHRLCQHSHMEKVGEFTAYSAPSESPSTSSAPKNPFQALTEGEAKAALAFLQQSTTLAFSHGLIDLFWRWAPPRLSYLRHMIEKGEAFWWREWRGLLAFQVDRDDEGNLRAYLKFAACALEELAAMLVAYCALSAQAGCLKAGWMAPLHPDLHAQLSRAGFAREWDEAMYVFEKFHPSARKVKSSSSEL